jgi:GTP:adenosylcobinamide-phosphate guanylyltransferase
MLDAIVTAGGIPQPDEPLYDHTLGKPKALLNVCGKPMIQWVFDALDQAETVGQIVVIGLDPTDEVHCKKAVAFLPNQGSMLENVRAGIIKVLELNPASRHTLAVSSDIPAITAEAVNWTVNTAMQSDLDLYYNVITRQVMEEKFPNSRRSYTRLKDVEVCGGDMNVLRTMTVTANDELWQRIIAARKNVLKQAALLGYDTLILLMLRLVTLEGAVKKVTRRINLTGQAILCPYAEIGMDVDKPHQLELVCEYLKQREGIEITG